MNDLAVFPIDVVTKAFKIYRAENDKIPTVSKILKICHAELNHFREVLCGPRYRPAEPRIIDTVPWYGLSWRRIQEKGFMPQIEQHLVELTAMHGEERAKGYLHYLQTNPLNAAAA